MARFVPAIFIGGGRLSLLACMRKILWMRLLESPSYLQPDLPTWILNLQQEQPFCSNLCGGKKSDNGYNISRYHCNWFWSRYGPRICSNPIRFRFVPSTFSVSRFDLHFSFLLIILILVELKSEPCIYEELNVGRLCHKILCSGFNHNYFVVQARLYDLCLSLLGLQMNYARNAHFWQLLSLLPVPLASWLPVLRTSCCCTNLIAIPMTNVIPKPIT